ncbi:hypothetical protein TL18_00555 [Methanobrevibacter sp. YE315]|nr:hypothetical protein TL18_00555 [Methanobrevibacter sp. YE315]
MVLEKFLQKLFPFCMKLGGIRFSKAVRYCWNNQVLNSTAIESDNWMKWFFQKSVKKLQDNGV